MKSLPLIAHPRRSGLPINVDVSHTEKILPIDQVSERVREAQQGGETVVMCHGCFDIVHPGHVRHLLQAAKHGDRLVVTITGDAVIDKGTGRPLIPQELRAENLAALDCVDWVAVGVDATAVNLLSTIRPDVYVKGREYERSRDPRFLEERAVVESYGGRIVFSSGDVVFSSTALIAAIEESTHPFHGNVQHLLAEHDLSDEALQQLFSGFHGQRVVVVGETMKDTYVMCNRPHVAGEGPMMTLRPIEHRSFDGGAAIIALHLAAMGARPILVTGLPQTTVGAAIRQRLEGHGIEVRAIELEQPLVEKQRYLVGQSKVMKVDYGEPLTLDASAQQQLHDLVASAGRDADSAILTDYGEGLLTAGLLGSICDTVRPLVSFMAGDVSGRRANLLALRHLDLVCPSEVELRDSMHEYSEGLSTVVARMLRQTDCAGAMVTMGPDGLIAFEAARVGEGSVDWSARLRATHVPSFVPHAVDELGCGDSLLAAATLVRAAGGSNGSAALIGSVAAAVQAERLGNSIIDTASIRRRLSRIRSAHLQYEPWIESPTTASAG